MLKVVLDFAFIALVTTFFTSLLVYCLKMRVVGGGRSPWAKDAHRDGQPIRYWTGIAGLVIGTAFSWIALVGLLALELH